MEPWRAGLTAVVESSMPCLPPYPLRDQLRRPDRALKVFRRALVLTWRCAPGGLRIVPATFRRAVHLLGRELFRPEEIVRLGLLRPDKSAADLRKVASRAAIERIADALNPVAARATVADKAVFHRTCERLAIRVPRMLAVARAGEPESWRESFASGYPRHFVIKPVVGGYGQDVTVYEQTSVNRFIAADGSQLSGEELEGAMMNVGQRHGCVIQERAWNHPGLERLSGSRYLQTVRLITLLDRTGAPHILHGHFKIIVGANWVDNYAYGRTGNFIAPISLTDGRLLPGAGANGELGGFRRVDRHPVTGVQVTGFQVPDWPAACELARTLAVRFAPLRWVGWDIALTPDGPLVIEGNWNTDAPNNSQCLDRIFDDLRRWW